ncbi:MAG: YcbK family protein [Sandaracinus sp.]|nr:YcbK family protein [Sandaracinus sp.]
MLARIADALGGLVLGASVVLGGAYALDHGEARAADPVMAPVRRLPEPRAIDALPVWLEDVPRKAPVTGEAPRTRTYAATFHHLHTREVLPVQADALPDDETLAHFFRCRATWEPHPLAHAPIEVAIAMAVAHDTDRIEVISGFRSPKLNELLRKKGREVAATSRHMSGEALDFRVPGVAAPDLAAAVGRTHVGGIGTYPISNFVHVDVGPARRWRGR